MLNRKEIIDVLIVAMTFTAFVTAMFVVQEASYQNGFSVAKTLVENSTIGASLRTPNDVRTIFGIVTAVSSDSVMLHTVSNDPFSDSALSDRSILVASSTTITKLTLKDIKVFQNEVAAYTKAIQSESTIKDAQLIPEPVSGNAANLADIKVGDTLMVIASTNIKLLKEFIAHNIMIQPPFTPPTNPQPPTGI